MTFSTDVAWLNIQELEPRVQQLLNVALRAMTTDAEMTPAVLYSDLKPFLASMIGENRGHIWMEAPAGPPAPHEVRFLEVALRDWTGSSGNNDYLHSQWLFDVACNHILDHLEATYTHLRGEAAA